ncbi:MAG: carbohydrate kinase [Bacteroidales bacterium]|nr:carbohydrate kinase [Bacteroidales bacterium]
MNLLGLDIGSSSIKATIFNAESGESLASSFYPKKEMEITAKKAGWAEQEPETWYENVKKAVREVINESGVLPNTINAIGISYQMHGLVLIDKDKKVLRPSIIWCDSRAVEIGNKAFNEIGGENCLNSLLNSPGNFTASKLKWVKDNEPELYKKIYKIMLPGDYIAMRLTDKINTTVSGLSEGIFWDFQKNEVSRMLLDYYGFNPEFIPDIVPTFDDHGKLTAEAASDLDLVPGIQITYRAGDQPNNAFSLNVLNPGEIAATAGTSGVVYGVSDQIKYDPLSRVNTFAHVNHDNNNTRLGVLLCLNGCGIQNSWLKKNIVPENINYPEMNHMAESIPVGSEGLKIFPFGNGAERMLNNKELGAQVHDLNFNIHSQAHFLRAAQEGIVFSLKYGIDVMHEIGINAKIIRAGKANMFLSSVFRQTLSNVTGATIELYDTDGSLGAARAAGVGVGIYKSFKEAFLKLSKLDVIIPDPKKQNAAFDAYEKWKQKLQSISQ